MYRNKVSYWVLVILIQLSRLISEKRLYIIANWIVRTRYQRSDKKIETVDQNISIAFGELTQEDKELFIEVYLRHHATTAVEMLLLLTDRFDLKSRIIDYDESAQKLKYIAKSANPNGAIFLTAHYGNWELLGVFTGEIGLPMSIVRKTMRNPLIYERIITPFRTKYGHREYERKGALKGIVSGLKQGYPVGLLIDEMIPPPNGVQVDFFSQKAYTLKSIAQLKRKYDPKIVCVFIERTEEGLFEIHIDEENYPQKEQLDEETEIQAITQFYTTKLEMQIRKNPIQWQWMYDRWRK